ncbi:hypothetical protein [Litorihabitans aurantiacus]|uniref:hypothetical protein n=1 Tax=Litorihabitans aurantiacus TaxID=1930061 RepID=UPI0024E1214F|nr:hypothetical protein [Litorihabitans aurantiacus]
MPGIHVDVEPWSHERQELRNARPVPRFFTPCRYPAGPIPVVVRLVWERDGVEVVRGRATAWTRQLVLVEVVDARLMVNGVWLALADVRRQASTESSSSTSSAST